MPEPNMTRPMIAAQRNTKLARLHSGTDNLHREAHKNPHKNSRVLLDTRLSSSALPANSTRHSVTSRIDPNSRLLSHLIFSTRHLNATPENRNFVEKFNTRIRFFSASVRKICDLKSGILAWLMMSAIFGKSSAQKRAEHGSFRSKFSSNLVSNSARIQEDSWQEPPSRFAPTAPSASKVIFKFSIRTESRSVSAAARKSDSAAAAIPKTNRFAMALTSA